MKEAKNGYGCDRHLFGLQTLAHEEGLPLPGLFSDPSFVKSGGNGHFILSTSTSGYTGKARLCFSDFFIYILESISQNIGGAGGTVVRNSNVPLRNFFFKCRASGYSWLKGLRKYIICSKIFEFTHKYSEIG